jgi:hypothetical protein
MPAARRHVTHDSIALMLEDIAVAILPAHRLMLFFGAIPLTPKSYSMDIVFAGTRSFLVSICSQGSE